MSQVLLKEPPVSDPNFVRQKPGRPKTRAHILKQAVRMFWFGGYEGTSLNDLVAEAGVSKGAFFHYYPNKQAIAVDVVADYAAQELKERLEQALGESADVKAALYNWISGIFEAYKAYRFKGGCLLGNLALELSDRDEAVREAVKTEFLEIENRLCSALKPLEAQGRLQMEARQLARLLIASIQGVTLMTKAHKDSNRAGREFMALGQLLGLTIRD